MVEFELVTLPSRAALVLLFATSAAHAEILTVNGVERTYLIDGAGATPEAAAVLPFSKSGSMAADMPGLEAGFPTPKKWTQGVT